MEESAVKAWEASGAIDPQRGSPLYNGRIPAEIRLLIFKLALEEDFVESPLADRDWCVRRNHDVDLDSDVEDGESVSGNGEPAQRNDTETVVQDDGESDIWAFDRMIEDDGGGEDEWDEEEWDEENDYWPPTAALHLWDRPEARGPPQAPAPVLRICRRSYLELAESTAHQAARRQMLVFRDRGPKMKAVPWNGYPWRARFYVQMYWLSDSLFSYMYKNVRPVFDNPGLLSRLRDLRLTFRRGDWWWNESNYPLHVDPFGTHHGTGVDPSGTHRDPTFNGSIGHLIRNPPTTSRGHAFLPADTTALARDLSDRRYVNPWTVKEGSGAPMLFPENSWALAFAQLPCLEKLTIDFETSPDKRAEMDEIVDWAVRDWIFPAYAPWRQDGQVQARVDEQDGGEARERFFSVFGNTVSKTSWRGLPQHYNRLCPGGASRFVHPVQDCEHCKARVRRLSKEMGPRLLVWTATWTARDALDDGTELVFREVVASSEHSSAPQDVNYQGHNRHKRRWGFRNRWNAAEFNADRAMAADLARSWAVPSG